MQSNNTQQHVDSNEGSVVGSASNSTVIGKAVIDTLIINPSPQSPDHLDSAQQTLEREEGRSPQPNPYKGLLAFQKEDAERFFGREHQIQQIWQKLCNLFDQDSGTRLLAIYGPSGSGKSSLARAGLVPELEKRPVFGEGKAQVEVLFPQTRPLYSLSKVLARMVTNDPTAVSKEREFEEELWHCGKKGYDGLFRIATRPEVCASPLILLIDQFEEIYTLCEDLNERDVFIENLLYAAQDRTKQLAVVITFRDGFMGETHSHPALNKLLCRDENHHSVPALDTNELRSAIQKPAEQAGKPLDHSIVELLVKDTARDPGALPLLQFTLTQIWDERENHNRQPYETLRKIGGVGEALAIKAQEQYEKLTENEKKIAPRIFVALVQIDETETQLSRRRVRRSELIGNSTEIPLIDSVIHNFSLANVRFLVTSSTGSDQELSIEVAHEALFQSWSQLRDWVEIHRNTTKQKNAIEEEASQWQQGQGYLLEGIRLRNAKEFMQLHKSDPVAKLSSLARKFIDESLNLQRWKLLRRLAIFSIFPLLGTVLMLHFLTLSYAESILWGQREECKRNNNIQALLTYHIFFLDSKDNLDKIQLCDEKLGAIDLDGAVLVGADFRKSVLKETLLMGANLTDAKFQQASILKISFDNANLRDAKFQGAFLYQSNFEGALNLTKNQLNEAKICEIIIPKEFEIEPNRDCKEYGF